MTEINHESEICQPEPKENSGTAETTDTTPDDASEITVPIKFNKEVKNLKLDEAAVLAQKGMKFDMISDNYERIKSLARSGGVSVPDYLSTLERLQNEEREESLTKMCGGNKNMAQHIIKLENSLDGNDDMGFAELREKIPEITDISQLPESVIEASNAKGTHLLDEFLRYRLDLENDKKQIADAQKSAAQSSVGSQHNTQISNNAASEFLKGLWG